MSTTAPVDRALTAEQVADSLGVSRTSFYRLRRRGDFPAADLSLPGRLGDARLQRWRASTVQRWLDELQAARRRT